MRQIIRATALAAMLGGVALPAIAQGPFAPVLYVNDAAVTQYELDQRTRFMQLLRAPDANRDTALQELVNDRLKMQAAELIGIAVTDEGLDEGLAEFAGRANMSVDQFIAALAEAGVERQAYRDFVTAGVAWREVVRQRIVPRIEVSEREIDQAVQRELQTPLTDAVLLSELIMPAPPGTEDQVMARAEEFTRTIRSEEAFAAAARQWSATPTAGRGGRLDWTPIADLPPSLQPIILALSPGQVTQPLNVPGAVVLFYLRDTRGRLRPGATDQTVEFLTMALPSAAEGARILAVADSCDQVHVQANRYAPDPVSRQTSPLGAVPADIAQRLSTLDENEGSVIDYGAGATLVMLCRRTPTLLADDDGAADETGEVAAAGGNAQSFPPVTPRDQMREQIFNRKINAAADAYLAELRADALVRQP